jgi:hypothetical protein
MKVKTIKELKSILKSEGVPEDFLKLLKNKNKEEFIRKFLEHTKARLTSEDDFGSDDDEVPFEVHHYSDDEKTPIPVQSLRHFRTHQAMAGGVHQCKIKQR